MTSKTKEGSSKSRSGSDMLKPGTTLMTCEPFAYASYLFDESDTLYFCDTCFTMKDRKDDLPRCKSCQVIRYCNRACQVKGWKDGHKYECDAMDQLLKLSENAPNFTEKQQFVYTVRLMVRIIVKLQDGNDYFDELKIGGKVVKRRFADLMSHSEEIEKDMGYLHSVLRTVQVPKMMLRSKPKIKIPSDEQLVEIFGKICINAYIIEDGYFSYGGGIYLGASIFNHSCVPMAVSILEGSTIHIKSTVEIPKSLPIDQVTIRYTSKVMPSQERRKDLMRKYHFLCDCERCKTGQFDKDMRSIICPKKGCNAKIDTEDMENPCSVCGHKMEMKLIRKIRETENQVLEIWECGNFDLNLMGACIVKMKSLNFSDSHWLMFRLYGKSFEEATTKEGVDKKKAYEYGSKYISALRLYAPPNNKQSIWEFSDMAWLCVSIGKIDEAESYMNEAKSIGNVLYGGDSPFMRARIGQLQEKIKGVKMIRGMSKLKLKASAKA